MKLKYNYVPLGTETNRINFQKSYAMKEILYGSFNGKNIVIEKMYSICFLFMERRQQKSAQYLRASAWLMRANIEK